MKTNAVMRPLFLCAVVLAAVLAMSGGPVLASSGLGHFGESIYLMAVEMPSNPVAYRTAIGDTMFDALTGGISTGKRPFSFDQLSTAQLAFLAGAVGPDACDKKYHFGIGFPIHKKYPQNALNIVNDLTAADTAHDRNVTRAFFYGWAFHYIADLVVHPALNEGNEYREGRDFAEHPPQHTILEGLIDRVCINYWFLLHPEKRIAPSSIIENARKSSVVMALFKNMADSWCKASAYSREYLKACGKAFLGVLGTDLGDLKNGLREAGEALGDGKERVQFLKSALFDARLKEFVARGVPEADIMSGKAKLSDFFPTDPSVRSVCAEGLRWWAEIMRNAAQGLTLASTREGFACNLDYGNKEVQPENGPDEKQKALIVNYYNSTMQELAK